MSASNLALRGLLRPCIRPQLRDYLILWAGRRHFGWAAGFFTAEMFLVSSLGAKPIGRVRIDGLFSLNVRGTGRFRIAVPASSGTGADVP